jgi:hypothetical protein
MPGRVDMRSVMRSSGQKFHRPRLTARQFIRFEPWKHPKDSSERLLVIGILDPRPQPRRIRGHRIFKRPGKVNQSHIPVARGHAPRVLFYPLNTATMEKLGPAPRKEITRALTFAALAVLAVLSWQALTVHVNYQGNWTGLFRIGYRTKLPPASAQGVFRNSNPTGYDGQYYRIMAHNPLLRDGTVAFLDDPLMRSRRILVPALAWLLVAGRQGLIDGAYVFVILAFIFAGTYWMVRLQISAGRHPAWGLCFLAVPAVLIAVDSMTVDVAIAALAAGFAWHLTTGRASALWLILVASALVRETGLLLPAACVLASMYRRDWRKATLWATTALPAFCWYGYVHAVLAASGAGHLALAPHFMIPRLELGILRQALEPQSYARFSPLLRTVAQGLDELALAGTVAVVVLVVVRSRHVRPLAQRTALVLYVLMFAAITSKIFWSDAYSYSRAFAPLFVLPMAGDRPRTALLLALLVDLRILAEFESQALHVLQWLAFR